MRKTKVKALLGLALFFLGALAGPLAISQTNTGTIVGHGNGRLRRGHPRRNSYGDGSRLNQASSSVGQVIDTQTVQNMPLNGRTFWQLTQLTPGVSFIHGGQNIATGGTSIRASAVNVNVNGLSPSWTGWYLDGANITEFQLGGTIIHPNVDALDEFKVESMLATPEIITTAARLLAAEAEHAGSIHTQLARLKIPSSPVDGADLIPPPSGKDTQYLSIQLKNGLVATRTAGQVLYLAFGMQANAKQGGFFPTGLNGVITMSSDAATEANLS
jgi:hypothetical protein